MNKLKLLVFCALVLNFVACSQANKKETKKEEQTNNTENWETIDETNYSINYPDTFVLDKSGKMGTRFILFSKQTSSQDLFRENINLVIQDLSSYDFDLDGFVKLSEKQIKTFITDGNLIESQRLSANNRDFQRLLYTGRQGKFNLKWLQYYWVDNNKAYILTLTCEVNQYDKYKAVGEKILQTFVIK